MGKKLQNLTLNFFRRYFSENNMSASSVGENMFGNNSMSNSSSSESDDEENSRLKEAAVGKEIKTSEILNCSQYKYNVKSKTLHYQPPKFSLNIWFY